MAKRIIAVLAAALMAASLAACRPGGTANNNSNSGSQNGKAYTQQPFDGRPISFGGLPGSAVPPPPPLPPTPDRSKAPLVVAVVAVLVVIPVMAVIPALVVDAAAVTVVAVIPARELELAFAVFIGGDGPHLGERPGAVIEEDPVSGAGRQALDPDLELVSLDLDDAPGLRQRRPFGG